MVLKSGSYVKMWLGFRRLLYNNNNPVVISKLGSGMERVVYIQSYPYLVKIERLTFNSGEDKMKYTKETQ